MHPALFTDTEVEARLNVVAPLNMNINVEPHALLDDYKAWFVQTHYQWETPSAVREFITEHSELYETLIQIAVVVNYFVKVTSLTLEVVDDWEWGEQQLLLTLHLVSADDKSAEEFERFRQQWWLERWSALATKVTIAIDYP